MASKCLRVAKLLRSNRSLTAAGSPFSGRYHSFSSSTAPNDHTCSRSTQGKDIVLQSSSMADMRHPFLKQGPKALCSVDEYELEAIVRVDMPGIGKEGLNLQVRNNAIQIEARAEKEPDYDEELPARAYSGLVALPPGFYNTGQIKATMKAGVLKIVIPKLKPEDMKDSSLIPPPIEFRAQWKPW